jgi:hypothetical protein
MLLRIVSLAALALIGCNKVADQRTANPVMPSPPLAPVNISGAYKMTLTASARCTSLPEFVRTRTYDAVITQDVTLTKGTLTMMGSGIGTFTITVSDHGGVKVSGRDVLIGLGYDGFRDIVPLTGALYIFGWGHLVADGSTIAGPLDGTISYSIDPDSFSNATNCAASDHHLAFDRK